MNNGGPIGPGHTDRLLAALDNSYVIPRRLAEELGWGIFQLLNSPDEEQGGE